MFFTLKKRYVKKFFKESYFTRVVLMNTHWAYEPTYQPPPNFVVTGQLLKDQKDLVKQLETKDRNLKDWMD